MRTQLILALLLGASLSAFAQSQEKDHLIKLNQEWLTAASLKDSNALNNLTSDEFKLISDRGQQLSKKDYINSMILSPGKISFEVDSTQVNIFGNSALVTTYQTTTIDDKPSKNCTSALYVKRNDIWQAVSLFIMLLRNAQ